MQKFFFKIIIIYSWILLLFSPPSVFSQAVQDTDDDSARNMNITDQEYDMSKQYVHEGINQKIKLEECEGIEAECGGKAADSNFLGMKASMVESIAKAYTMIMGSMQAPMDLRESVSAKLKEKNPSHPGTKQDYCRFIAMGTEAIAAAQQAMSQEDIKMKQYDTSGNVQKNSLYQVAESHKKRADMAKIQAGGMAATTACYAAMIYPGGVKFSSVMLKLPAAGLLTAFYTSQAAEHEKFAEKTKEIADKLPGAGECNPVTERACFCSEETSSFKDPINYKKYCIPSVLHNNPLPQNAMRVSCLNSQLKADPQCSCMQSNSCYDRTHMAQLSSLGLSATTDKSYTPFASMTRGSLLSGNLAAGSGGHYALAARSMKAVALKHPLRGSLTNKQKVEARALTNLGIPGALAGRFSKSPMSSQAKSHQGRFRKMMSSSKGPSSLKAARSTQDNVLTFQGGKGITQKKTRKIAGQKSSKTGSSKGSYSQQVLNFAKAAQQTAQISEDKDRHIFKIISRRYQISGKRRLQIK